MILNKNFTKYFYRLFSNKGLSLVLLEVDFFNIIKKVQKIKLVKKNSKKNACKL